MDIKKRIKEFISDLKISQCKFEKNVGLSNGYISNINKTINIEVLNKIMSAYPSLNIKWLLEGEGEKYSPGTGILQTGITGCNSGDAGAESNSGKLLEGNVIELLLEQNKHLLVELSELKKRIKNLEVKFKKIKIYTT